MGQHLAVRLHGELFQGLVGRIKGFALGAESGVAQARAALFTGRTGIAAVAVGAVRLELVVGALARAARLAAWAPLLAVTELTATPRGCGLDFFHAGAIIAATRHDRL